MDSGTLAAITTLVTVVTQLGLATGAWRLANALRSRVDDHEVRIGVLERNAN